MGILGQEELGLLTKAANAHTVTGLDVATVGVANANDFFTDSYFFTLVTEKLLLVT